MLLLVGCRCLVVFKLKIPDLHTVTDALNLHLSKCIKSKRAHSRRRGGGEMGEVASLCSYSPQAGRTSCPACLPACLAKRSVLLAQSHGWGAIQRLATRCGHGYAMWRRATCELQLVTCPLPHAPYPSSGLACPGLGTSLLMASRSAGLDAITGLALLIY